MAPDRPHLPPPSLPPAPRAPYTAGVALDADVAVTDRLLFAAGRAIMVATTSGSLSYTAFCGRGSVRALPSHLSPLPVECRACPNGYLSVGGVNHECVLCDDLYCAAEGQTTFNAEFVGLSRNETLKTADLLTISMTAYGKAAGGLPQGERDSQGMILDLTAPYGGAAIDVEPNDCNRTIIPGANDLTPPAEGEEEEVTDPGNETDACGGGAEDVAFTSTINELWGSWSLFAEKELDGHDLFYRVCGQWSSCA